MENTPTSEHSATDWGDDVRNSFRDDIGLDGRWKYQRLREGTPGCKSVGFGRLLTSSFAVIR